MAENEYERARRERIEENHKKMEALGLQTAAQELRTAIEPMPRPRAPPRKRKTWEVEVEVRRCARLAGQEPKSLAEDTLFEKIGIDRLDVIFAPRRRRRIGVDPERLNELRERRVREVDGEGARGPVDSGLGVRIQGGRVYDSKYGVTCHWCRQKTLEDHVTCTNEDCGGGRKLPVSFCKLCLKNRHGEDIAQAEASGKWVCPGCRGSCGEGCRLCCNCGPCRKAAGLAPTRQVIQVARAAGFDNVHDYLVHQATGEGAEDIAARKRTHAWGAWQNVPFDPEATASEADSEATVSERGTEEEEDGQEEVASAATLQEEEEEPVEVALADGLLELHPEAEAEPCLAARPAAGDDGDGSSAQSLLQAAPAPMPRRRAMAPTQPSADEPELRRSSRQASSAAVTQRNTRQGNITAFLSSQQEQLPAGEPAKAAKAGAKVARPATLKPHGVGAALGLRSRKAQHILA